MHDEVRGSRGGVGGDYLGLRGIDHIEIYAGNSRQAAHFYRSALGFSLTGYRGLETGARDRESFVMRNQDIKLLLTSALNPESEIAAYVHRHGDAVKDVAFAVSNAEESFHKALERGARPLLEPLVTENETGSFTRAAIAGVGDTVHSLISRNGTDNSFAPGQVSDVAEPASSSTYLTEVDHVAICVEAGELDNWVGFYKEVLGFHQSHQEDVMTELSGMNSKVVQNSTGTIKFPILEPAPGKKKSQIEEFLGFNRGPGIQHVAFEATNIVRSVTRLRSNEVEFLSTPDSYYELLKERVGDIDEEIEALKQLNILADRDEWGYLLQIFSKPIQSRPTLFFEVIERKGAKGFGAGNIRALFEANERQQAARGNL